MPTERFTEYRVVGEGRGGRRVLIQEGCRSKQVALAIARGSASFANARAEQRKVVRTGWTEVRS